MPRKPPTQQCRASDQTWGLEGTTLLPFFIPNTYWVLARGYSGSEQDRQGMDYIYGGDREPTRKVLGGMHAIERIKWVHEMDWVAALHGRSGIKEGLSEEVTFHLSPE